MFALYICYETPFIKEEVYFMVIVLGFGLADNVRVGTKAQRGLINLASPLELGAHFGKA